jgi:type II secretory pathway component PulM
VSAFLDSWRARPEGERRLLGAGATVAILILIATLLWLPMERERRRLASDIPKLTAALATMERQADEVKRVRSLPATTPATAAPLASLVSSGVLTRTIPGSQATIADDKRVRIVAADAPYGALLESIASAQSTHGLRVESARIEALGPPAGRVRAELTLAKP